MSFDNVDVSPDMARLVRAAARARNEALAQMLREASKLHEASYDPNHGPLSSAGIPYGKYTRTHEECIREVVGDDPIALILDCLFTAGYCEMWDFCDQVLGKEDTNADK